MIIKVLTLLAMSDTFEPFLLSLPPMLSREPAFDSEVNEPLILVLVKIVMRARYIYMVFRPLHDGIGRHVWCNHSGLALG